jgi:hypothetical protein
MTLLFRRADPLARYERDLEELRLMAREVRQALAACKMLLPFLPTLLGMMKGGQGSGALEQLIGGIAANVGKQQPVAANGDRK